jgi:shikimate kinase
LINLDIGHPQIFTHAPFARNGVAVYSPEAMETVTVPAFLKLDRPITLVGLMGAGKSTIGRRLAQRLHLDFIDADHEIEVAAGLSIPEIFERFGEAHFRDGERRVIARLIDGKPRIIATGGGAFMNERTRDLMLTKSITVWIDADIDTLADRVARKDNRPLLKGRDPKIALAELAQVRNPVYALAPIHVISQTSPHDATVEAILKALPCK